MFERKEGRVIYASLAHRMAHGVVGAMLLHDLAFPGIVVDTVSTHAANSPFHGSNVEAYILHYADFFSADHAIMNDGGQPFYQKHWQ